MSSPAVAAPKRGRPPRISQQRIVEAAVHLGLDAFSMQGIAEHLGVSTPALYSHVAGRDEVLALVDAAVQERLRAFTSPAGDWRGWLVDFAGLVRRDLASSASSLMADLRRSRTSSRAVVGERGLELLIGAGLSPTDAAYAVWLVFRTALTAGPEHTTAFAGYVDGTGELLATGDLPATRAVHDALAAGGPHDTFEFDLAVVLAGIADRIERTERR